MKLLQTQNINKQDFSVFLRDLSLTLNVNLKHMIEDLIINKEKNNNKKNYHKGKKVVKKKDLIIQQQNEKKKKANYNDDLNKIDFLIHKLDPNNPFENIKNFKTDSGKLEFQKKLLEYFWEHKSKNIHNIFSLYFSIKDNNNANEILSKVDTMLDEYDYKLFMMKKMGNMLPPLDVWNQTKQSFEDWQIQTIKYVNQNESVIVKAPTSSGKSFIAMSAGIFHKKILYVCPAKPVVYQVGAHFINMGYKVHFLVDNLSYNSYDSKTNIFIGIPSEIENHILTIGNDFDYAVFDEIHNLNKIDDGDSYENIIKLINCKFLALSATIKNVEYLKDCFHKINPSMDIHLIEYNKRFINQQRWIWNDNKYQKIHPFCIYDSIDDLQKINALPFTPNDCAKLWETIEEVFEDIIDDIDECSPDEYFTEKRILTLEDCRIYEEFLKDKCIELSNKYPKEIESVFNKFNFQKKQEKTDIIKFIKASKEKDMFPMIMFHTDENECKNIFTDIFNNLEQNELEDYPYHYEILEKKQEIYKDFVDKKDSYKSNIKISQNTKNPEYFIKDKMESFERKAKDNYIKIIDNFYESKIAEIKNSDKDETIKKKQLNNITKERNEFLSTPDFCIQDVFKKHKDFIFTRSNKPMDADTIRTVRREIKKTLGIKIEYENQLFQMLKRGIGIYIDNMPDEYNWILQKLLSNKEIGIVISDRTLCLGIDLPVRSSCFLGINNNKISRDEYLQMAGRAGRRGKDTQGNIIFYGDIDYITLMKGELPEIKGNNNPIYSLCNVHSKASNLYSNMVNPERKVITIDCPINEKNKKIIWKLRNFPKVNVFANILPKLEKKIYMLKDYEREEYLLEIISDIIEDKEIIEIYKKKKLQNFQQVNRSKQMNYVLIKIHNQLNYQQYMITMNLMRDIFQNFNRMIYNYII
jgi:superfamily II RNA helicase